MIDTILSILYSIAAIGCAILSLFSIFQGKENLFIGYLTISVLYLILGVFVNIERKL